MRQTIPFCEGWRFIGSDIGPEEAGQTLDGEPVTLPHTWNGTDGQRGGVYDTGCRWYVKTFSKPEFSPEGRAYIEFKAAGAVAEVWLNGRLLNLHRGGYSAFRVDMTEALQQENTLCVGVDNSLRDDLYPHKADFTFYGGIYRDVTLILVEKEHFDLDFRGGQGFKVDTSVEGDTGSLLVTTWQTGGEARVLVTDAEGTLVAQDQAGEPIQVENVHRWDGIRDPYLYTVTVELTVGERVVDRVMAQVGFRSYRIDPERGFFLNEKSFSLRGASRHQDRPGKGNALSRADHEEDINLMAEMGVNAIRLAHYQHDDYFYDLCDRYGMVVWSEIPYISEHLEGGDENAVQQMEELIVQTYNHPSILFRCLSNEVTMVGGDRERMVALHERLHALCKEWDPSRYTAVALYSLTKPDHPIVSIPDVTALNLYFGWYSPGRQKNGVKFDRFRTAHPTLPIGMSETGADALPEIHAGHPLRGDNSEEYQCIFHEAILKTVEERESMWCLFVWNMFDFAAANRTKGPDPGKNHKGLVTFDRKTKKDAFYLYKAHWSTEPFVHICGKRFRNRVGRQLKLKVYSNQPEVELFVGGVSQGKKTGRFQFEFSVPMKKGNKITVKAGNCTDSANFRHVWLPDKKYYAKHARTISWEKQDKREESLK